MSTGELTDAKRKKLLEAAQKIHAHKIMQAKGFRILAQKARDESIRQLLLRN
jgi:hypothetical protein